jgi:hypothetical protein
VPDPSLGDTGARIEPGNANQTAESRPVCDKNARDLAPGALQATGASTASK